MNTKVKQGFTALPPQPADQMPPFDSDHIRAFRAIAAGKATEDQQLLFVRWFNTATGAESNPWRRGGEDGRRETDLACGKKMVGDWFYAVVKAVIQQ